MSPDKNLEPKMRLKEWIKGAVARMGFHIMRINQSPRHTFMGLRRFDIRTVLDVGANVGQFARYVRRFVPKAQVHCFEPNPAAFRELDSWARGEDGVVAVQLALGDKAGTAEMYVHKNHNPSSSLLKSSAVCTKLYPFTEEQEKVEIRLELLDNYVEQLGGILQGGVLLKLDVQGFEGSVLRGARRVLQQVRVCLVEVSIETLYVGQSTFSEVHDCLVEAGLVYAGNFAQAFGADGRVVFVDAVFIRP